MRARSQGMAGIGIGLVGIGALLAASRPSCGYDGSGTPGGGFGTRYSYEAAYVNGKCDVAVVVSKSRPLFISPDLRAGIRSPHYEARGAHVEYVNDIVDGSRNFFVAHDEVSDITPTTGKAKRYIGLSLAGAGAFLIWYGLSRVEVPFRMELTAGHGIGVRGSRTFTW